MSVFKEEIHRHSRLVRCNNEGSVEFLLLDYLYYRSIIVCIYYCIILYVSTNIRSHTTGTVASGILKERKDK